MISDSCRSPCCSQPVPEITVTACQHTSWFQKPLSVQLHTALLCLCLASGVLLCSCTSEAWQCARSIFCFFADCRRAAVGRRMLRCLPATTSPGEVPERVAILPGTAALASALAMTRLRDATLRRAPTATSSAAGVVAASEAGQSSEPTPAAGCSCCLHQYCNKQEWCGRKTALWLPVQLAGVIIEAGCRLLTGLLLCRSAPPAGVREPREMRPGVLQLLHLTASRSGCTSAAVPDSACCIFAAAMLHSACCIFAAATAAGNPARSARASLSQLMLLPPLSPGAC